MWCSIQKGSMKALSILRLPTLSFSVATIFAVSANAQAAAPLPTPSQTSRKAQLAPQPPASAQYQQLQKRLATGWNTWDVHSVTTQVLLPQGLAIHVGLQHNATEGGDAYLGDALIGRQSAGAEQVFPGAHSWNGSYTDLRLSWKGHELRLQTAHDGNNLVILATPLPSQHPASVLPATIVFSVNYLWDRPGSVIERTQPTSEAHGSLKTPLPPSTSTAPARSRTSPEKST